MKFKIFFLKVEYEGELQISESNLFHSTNTDGKKEPRKKIIDRGKSVELNGSIFMMYQWVFLGKLKDCEYFVVRNLAYL